MFGRHPYPIRSRPDAALFLPQRRGTAQHPLVMDHSQPAAWQAHHAAFQHLPMRHASTFDAGYFSAGPFPAQPSPLRFIYSSADYSQVALAPAGALHPMGQVHRVLTPEGYPSGLMLVVNPVPGSNAIPCEVERLAALAEQGVPVPQVLSYGHFHGYSAMLMQENAPLYAATAYPRGWAGIGSNY